MLRASLTGQRLVAVFLLGCLVFNYPLLFLFNSPDTVFGVPALYAYLFCCWLVLIGLMAIVIERRREKQ